MKEELEYEVPRVVELEVSVFRGENGEYANVSNAKFEAFYDEEDAAHETLEF